MFSSQYCSVLYNSHLWMTGFVSKLKYHQVIENQFRKVGAVIIWRKMVVFFTLISQDIAIFVKN